MVSEKIKLLVRRLVWGLLAAATIIIPLVFVLFPDKEVEIESTVGNVKSYSGILDKTSYEIEITFNTKVSSCHILVSISDSKGKILSIEEGDLYGNGKTLSKTFTVNGKAEAHNIVDFEAKAARMPVYIVSSVILIFVAPYVLCIFIASLFLSCRVYDYYGIDIIVYTGWFHRYLKVNGEKTDEHNTLITFTPIRLSCTMYDGTDLKATITLTNRISLKVNNLLYTKRK